MEYFLLSFIAGILTILAPCVLPMLPIIIGGGASGNSVLRPLIVTASLTVSIIIFTLLIKVSTIFIDIPQEFWKIFSGAIIIVFGITMIFPYLWDYISVKLGFNSSSQELLNESAKKEGIWGMVLIGASLGPVFSSCSPTYFLILGTVLPQSFAAGLINLIIYSLGLALMMFLIAFFGQKLTSKLQGISSNSGITKKVLGSIFIFIGIAIIMGYDKSFETWLLNFDFYSNLGNLEQSFIESVKE